MRMVARQPIHPDFTGNGFPEGFQRWGTRTHRPNTSKTSWSVYERMEIRLGGNMFPRLKGGSYGINDCLFVCLFVTGSKEHHRQGYLLRGLTMVRRVNRCGELEFEVRFPRTTMVTRQPIYPDFIEKGFPGGIATWGTRIRRPFA